MTEPMIYAATALAVLDSLPLHMRARRALLGLSIRRAAADIGIHFTTLDRIERGQSTPSLDATRAILRWLDRTNHSAAPAGVPEGGEPRG